MRPQVASASLHTHALSRSSNESLRTYWCEVTTIIDELQALFAPGIERLLNSTQTHLFHKQEDVCLGCFQHAAVRMLQAFHCQTHCPAVNVDPAGGTGGQEGPEHTDTPDQYGAAWPNFSISFLL